MEGNQFGKTSRLSLSAVEKEGKTILRDVAFTAPYKVMQPFHKRDGGIRVMLLAASAGIMEGDRQEFSFHVAEGADLEFVSQSYDKIHQMKEGCAKRKTWVHVSSGGRFCFNPQPTIPFKDSAFENEMQIELEDEGAQFAMSEIFSCGRYASGERFAYRFYHNLVEIRRGGRLIYRDNVRYEPDRFVMEGMGMYESYTHLSSIFLTKPKEPEAFAREVHELLERERADGEITRLSQGDYVVRIFGRRAQTLEELNRRILEMGEVKQR